VLGRRHRTGCVLLSGPVPSPPEKGIFQTTLEPGNPAHAGMRVRLRAGNGLVLMASTAMQAGRYRAYDSYDPEHSHGIAPVAIRSRNVSMLRKNKEHRDEAIFHPWHLLDGIKHRPA
jgi:hypothetical protein